MEPEDALLIHLFPSDLEKTVRQLQTSTLVGLGILFGQEEGNRKRIEGLFSPCFCFKTRGFISWCFFFNFLHLSTASL